MHYFIMRWLLFFPFHLWLKHLIKRNYRMRAITAISRAWGIPVLTPDGKEYDDEWYWADELCSKYRYFVEYRVHLDKWLWKQLRPWVYDND